MNHRVVEGLVTQDVERSVRAQVAADELEILQQSREFAATAIDRVRLGGRGTTDRTGCTNDRDYS
ncbi:MAG: hypothetical protein ACREL7_13855 [Longimicrobiales bacterium]